MHPLVGLVAIFGGISLFGIFGVFIGPILMALVISALNVWPLLAERAGILKAAQVVTAQTSMPEGEKPAPAQKAHIIAPA